MDYVAIHVEDERRWREAVKRSLSRINEFDVVSRLRSVSSINGLEKALQSFTGKIIIIIDLRLGGDKRTNYDGFHWILKGLPNLVSRNASTSVYIVTGRFEQNELLREALERNNIPPDHIFDKGEWDEDGDRFTESIKHDIIEMNKVAYENIAKKRAGGAIDSYLIHRFQVLGRNRSTDPSENSQAIPELPVLPMLVRAKSKDWNYHHIRDIKILSRIGEIFAGTGTVRTIAELERDPNVISVEASRPAMSPDCEKSIPFVRGSMAHQTYAEKGDKALIAVIDTGIDILHEAFMDSTNKKSRILAIWDQRDQSGPTPESLGIGNYDTGTLHTESAIAGYIRDQSVPKFLKPGVKDHGTHVASIAAGQSTSYFSGGMAPEAKIVVVITRAEYELGYPFSLGYSVSHHSALAFIRDFSSWIGLPVVINVSQGMNAGAHDGSSNLEVTFDAITGNGKEPGIVVVKSAGNERDKLGHAFLQVADGSEETLRWDSSDEDRIHQIHDEIELWFDAADKFSFCLIDPQKHKSDWVSLSNPVVSSTFPRGNEYRMSYDAIHSDNGDNKLLISVDLGASHTILSGEWKLRVRGMEVNTEGYIHAWVERTNERPIRFLNHVSEGYTLSIPGTSHWVISVGSVFKENPISLAQSSSYGPTRDEREKPDICAPGEEILAALSGEKTRSCALSGTSMAAPHVTGAIALLLSARQKAVDAKQKDRQLNTVQILSALKLSTQNYRPVWNKGMGFGLLDVHKFIQSIL